MEVIDHSPEWQECIHGIWPVTSCQYCNGKAEQERREAMAGERIKYTFAAKYRGMCTGGCREYIEPGDMICVMVNAQYWCETCANRTHT